MWARCVDLNFVLFNFAKSDGEAEAHAGVWTTCVLRQARRRWRVLCWRQGASGGRLAAAARMFLAREIKKMAIKGHDGQRFTNKPLL